MRRKPLPPPPDDFDAVVAARDAVPLVPGSEDDCCARLAGRLGLPGRDVAGRWLTLLVALGLAEEGARGFTRVREAPTDRAALAEAFVAGVYGAREALDALASADEALDPAAVAEATAAAAPGWERRKHGSDWPAVWRSRTADLLGWLALLGLAERLDGGYRPAATE